MKKKENIPIRVKTAQDFINIKLIKDNLIYTKDNNIIAFLKLKGIQVDLKSNNEKLRLIKGLVADLTRIDSEFTLFAISRPFNIEPLIKDNEIYIKNANDIQRKILRIGMKQITDYIEDGEAIERLIFIKIYDKLKDEVIRKQNLIKEAFDNAGVKADLVNNNEITLLINLFNNPKTFNYDHINNNANFINIDLSKIEEGK